MIDYKLVLILILSIVLLFVYNKTEELRQEVDNLKKKKNQVDNLNKVKTSEELLNLFQEKNRIITEDSELKKNTVINCKPIIESSNNHLKCEIPVLSKNQSLNKSFIVEKDNTSCYNATESSEEIDINYEDASTSQNEEYIVFSNDKEKSEIINIKETLETLEANNSIIIENSDLLISTALLSKTYDGQIDIINDSSNSEEKNNIKIEELTTYSELSKENSEEKIMKEFDNIEIINENGMIHLQKVNEDEYNDDNEFEKKYEEQDNLNSNDNSESNNEDINISEFQKINLTSINKYKLEDLQKIAIKFNIDLIKKKNGKETNKTKKELYNELTLQKEN